MASFKKPSTNVTQYVDKPGWFHLAVTRVEDQPIYNGEMKDQVNVSVVVLGGTDVSQVKRELTMRLNNPNEGQKDGGEFCARVQTRLAVACDILAIITNESGERQYCEINNVPEGADMEIDWVGQEHRDNPEAVAPWIVGKQFVAKLHEEEYNGKKSIKPDGAHFYHVSDPDVAHVPLNAEALKLGNYKVPPRTVGNNAAPAAPADKPADKPAASGAKGAAAAAPAKSSPSKPAGKPATNGAKPVAAGAYDDL